MPSMLPWDEIFQTTRDFIGYSPDVCMCECFILFIYYLLYTLFYIFYLIQPTTTLNLYLPAISRLFLKVFQNTDVIEADNLASPTEVNIYFNVLCIGVAKQIIPCLCSSGYDLF